MHPISRGCSRQDRGILVEVKLVAPYSEVPWVVNGKSQQALEGVRGGMFKHDSYQRQREHIEDEGVSLFSLGKGKRLVV
ncbi:hypothetical protein FF2_027568 [Malus domestica]